MILGSNEITPLSMATAMATLAAEGNSCSPITFTSITDNDGAVLLEKTPSCKQVIEPELARETTAVLQYVMTPGSTGENAILYGRQAARKDRNVQRRRRRVVRWIHFPAFRRHLERASGGQHSHAWFRHQWPLLLGGLRRSFSAFPPSPVT